mgnify:CR=1 FL=1
MKELFFNRDSTNRFSCRKGDYLIWFGPKGVFSSNNKIAIKDIWQLKDGDFLTITNRYQDLPNWFELHPIEASNKSAYWMKEKLNSGYVPGAIMKANNIWRIYAGDRLVLIGNSRDGFDSDEGILSIITFNTNAIVIGDSQTNENVFEDFGSISNETQTEEEKELFNRVYKTVLELKQPRSISMGGQWTMG